MASLALGERGRLVLPGRLRRRLDLKPGDRLIVTLGDKSAISQLGGDG